MRVISMPDVRADCLGGRVGARVIRLLPLVPGCGEMAGALGLDCGCDTVAEVELGWCGEVSETPKRRRCCEKAAGRLELPCCWEAVRKVDVACCESVAAPAAGCCEVVRMLDLALYAAMISEGLGGSGLSVVALALSSSWRSTFRSLASPRAA